MRRNVRRDRQHALPHPAALLSTALLAAGPVAAEVLDKEPTYGQIWLSVVVAAGLAVVAAALQRWLLWLSFLLFLPSAAVFAWTESHNFAVGPAILAEAGSGYRWNASAAVAVAVVVHLALWRAATAWRTRRKPKPGLASKPRDFLFAFGLLALLALASTSGFGAEANILTSPPFWVAGTGLAFFAFRRVGPGGLENARQNFSSSPPPESSRVQRHQGSEKNGDNNTRKPTLP